MGAGVIAMEETNTKADPAAQVLPGNHQQLELEYEQTNDNIRAFM